MSAFSFHFPSFWVLCVYRSVMNKLISLNLFNGSFIQQWISLTKTKLQNKNVIKGERNKIHVCHDCQSPWRVWVAKQKCNIMIIQLLEICVSRQIFDQLSRLLKSLQMNTTISNYQQDFSPTWIDKKRLRKVGLNAKINTKLQISNKLKHN